jgi:hypothetical protein
VWRPVVGAREKRPVESRLAVRHRGKQLRPTANWSDLALPDAKLRRLRRLADEARRKDRGAWSHRPVRRQERDLQDDGGGSPGQ